MPAHWIEPGATIVTRRGEAVVCIPLHGAHEQFVGCLRSVLAHTPPSVKLAIWDDASPDRRSEDIVRMLDKEGAIPHELYYLRREQNIGFPANINGAFAAVAPGDVVLLNSDCVVADGWIDRLREAAYVDSTVATATALTNHGSVVSVPVRGVPVSLFPQEWNFDDAAKAIARLSPRLRPRIVTAVGHCVYVRRDALELVGDFDLAFTPGYGEEVDFSQRCLRNGLCHVVADDVLVMHHGGASLTDGARPNPTQAEHEQMLATRYPYYQDAVSSLEQDVIGPVARSLSSARRALKGLSLVIDGRILVAPMTGTQLHALELIVAVARTGEAQITVLVQSGLDPAARDVLRALDDLTLTTVADGAHAVALARHDVVHRPFQISGPNDLALLTQLGERLVVTHQDLISYRNPSYFASFAHWDRYRRLTRRALALADRTVFFSSHARDDAIAEDLVEPHRASVVHIGVDHTLSKLDHAPVAPRGAVRLPADAELMICIGTDFRHKNRVFALRLADELQQTHGWEGRLAFVGPRVERGSSAPEEDELLLSRPALARAVVDFAAVDEAEKAWLMSRARLIVYPTVYEGFGLVPFEAAHAGVPCMWAEGTSLSEILPDAVAGIVPWDPVQSAVHALQLLRDEPARKRNVEAICKAAEELTWEATAKRLLEVYRDACDSPAAPTAALERTGMMNAGVSEDAIRLVGPTGALPRELERPLLALATHPQVGAPVFRAIQAGYRASYRWRRRNGG